MKLACSDSGNGCATSAMMSATISASAMRISMFDQFMRVFFRFVDLSTERFFIFDIHFGDGVEQAEDAWMLRRLVVDPYRQCKPVVPPYI